MEYQATINCDIEFSGIALHSGRNVTLRLKPAPPNTGIIFRRIDLPGKPEIPARIEFVKDTLLCTELGNNNVRVKTVEHFLSALFGLGIDNLYVEINGCEIPAMDGSSYPFVEKILKAGIKYYEEPKKIIKIKKRIEIKKGERIVIIEPSDKLSFSFYIEYAHPLIGIQMFSFDFSTEKYISEISKARTYGFLYEIEKLRKNNLGLGGSLENAIVLTENSILNPEGLRFKDEFVRHKILDAIGDLSLLGCFFIGKFTGIKSGHELNFMLCKKLIQEKSSVELINKNTYKYAIA